MIPRLNMIAMRTLYFQHETASPGKKLNCRKIFIAPVLNTPPAGA